MLSYLEKYLVGFSYGISFPLTLVILDYWLKDLNISNSVIASFSLLHLPFTFKFFWGILIENYDIPILSKFFPRHFSWVVLSHIILLSGIFVMVCFSHQIFFLMLGASLTALGDGCKNVVLYPYQIAGCKNEKNFGYVANMVGLGHRLGTIFIKVSMLYIANFFGWSVAYTFSAIVILISLFILYFINKKIPPENFPEKNATIQHPKIFEAFTESVVVPLKNLYQREDGWRIFALLIFYKSADFFNQKMTRLFLVENGFTKTEIANIVQFFGAIAVILGGFIGGFCIKKIGVQRAMMILGLVHACVFPIYTLLVYFPHDSALLSVIISLEGITGGAIAASFLTFIYTISSRGSLYAILWAIHECGMIFFMSFSGIFAKFLGWEKFFLLTPLIFLPNLWLFSPQFTQSSKISPKMET